MYVLHAFEAQTLAEKQSSFKVFFITQIGHTPGFSNTKRGPSEDLQQTGSFMTILGLQYDAGTTKKVPEPYKKQLLHIFPASGIVNYIGFISIPLHVRLN